MLDSVVEILVSHSMEHKPLVKKLQQACGVSARARRALPRPLLTS
jgi:hypothetical protein